ncbi:MAG: oligoribonuclease [Candidatus Saccharimonadales bacterium]
MSDIDKNRMPTKLLWVDLEMTGLDATSDVILEVAAEITDFQGNKLASYCEIIHQPADIITSRMEQNPWWQSYPENKEDFIRKCAEGKPSYEVENELIALLAEHFGNEPAILAGNSIYNDRNFMKHWWPKLDQKLHYRMLDVSSWKVFMQGKYGVNYEKQDVHRAYDDIQASMTELDYYLSWLKQLPTDIT